MARFYTLVTRDTVEQDPFAEKRQRFLTEQGYAYDIVDFDAGAPTPFRSVRAPAASRSDAGERRQGVA
jgi:hypothetical protein